MVLPDEDQQTAIMARLPTFPKIYNTYFLACISTIGYGSPLDREIAEDDVLTLELHSGMLFGFDISSISAIIVTKQYIDYFDNPSGIWQGVCRPHVLFCLCTY